ncbi:MAG: tyrosine-protein phosphatase [Rhodobacter sp.]|nr:tyrosine-protein phosphatase [Rhodobacter sp.]
MLGAFFNRIHQIERKFSRSFGTDISTPRARRNARWHFYMSDHGFLRGLWTNQFEIAPGVWRSNQPSQARLRKLAAIGIKTVLNLRGEDKFSFFLFEREACEALGLTLINHKIYARSLVPAARFAELFEIFDRIEKPFVLHCKSGADRAGLVSALWLLDQENASIDDAKAMLSFRYVHLKRTRTGVLDHLLETYEADFATDPMPIRQWFAEKYDPAAITASFHAKMGWPAPEPA